MGCVTHKKRGQYNSIDFAKIIMAVFVIAIHTKPLDGCTNLFLKKIFETVFNYAVPFFFITSVFLLSSKLSWPYNSEEDLQTIKKYLKKLLDCMSFGILYIFL